MSFSSHLDNLLKCNAYNVLSDKEISLLEKNGNKCLDWNRIRVHKNCNISHIQNNIFENSVFLGPNKESKIISSHLSNVTVGNNSSIIKTSLIENFIIEDNSLIENCGYITSSQGFSDFIIEICNENGSRSVRVSPEISNTAIWLISRKIFEQKPDPVLQKTGYIGNNVLIRNLSEASDLHISDNTVIKNVSSLENVFIDSELDNHVEITHIVSLKNSIIKKSCRISKGVIAQNIFLCENSSLINGARVFHVFLGSNSTIACCEVLNSFISSFHEQHHNNSFLISASIMGQSNIAAGATIGSNHNSRSADGEIIASRGFWRGLNVSLKHNSYFAAFTMIAKGSYTSEIYNPFPFSLIYLDNRQLVIRPAFLFKYNSYALHRNSWKFSRRDKRNKNNLDPVYHFIAPDTVSETFKAIKILEKKNLTDSIGFFEKSKTPVIIKDAESAITFYTNKLNYFLSLKLLSALSKDKTLISELECSYDTDWFILGDFSVRKDAIDLFWKNKNLQGKELYNFLNKTLQKEQKYILPYYISVLLNIRQIDNIKTLLVSKKWIKEVITMHLEEKENILSNVRKDLSENFRKITFLYNENPEKIYGSLNTNQFIQDYLIEHDIIMNMLNNYLSSIS